METIKHVTRCIWGGSLLHEVKTIHQRNFQYRSWWL